MFEEALEGISFDNTKVKEVMHVNAPFQLDGTSTRLIGTHHQEHLLVLSYKALDASAMDHQTETSLLHHQDYCIGIEMSVLYDQLDWHISPSFDTEHST